MSYRYGKFSMKIKKVNIDSEVVNEIVKTLRRNKKIIRDIYNVVRKKKRSFIGKKDIPKRNISGTGKTITYKDISEVRGTVKNSMNKNLDNKIVGGYEVMNNCSNKLQVNLCMNEENKTIKKDKDTVKENVHDLGIYEYRVHRIAKRPDLKITVNNYDAFLHESCDKTNNIIFCPECFTVESIFHRALLMKATQGVSEATIDKYITDFDRFIKGVLSTEDIRNINRNYFLSHVVAAFFIFQPSYTTFRNFKSLWRLIINYALEHDIYVDQEILIALKRITHEYMLIFWFSRIKEDNEECYYFNNIYIGDCEDIEKLFYRIYTSSFIKPNYISERKKLRDYPFYIAA